jgi:hypothetical protein
MAELKHELLTSKEATESLSVKQSALCAWVRQRKIPL